ncbi:MAG: hypothetical protein K0S01_1660 [Herbinix sp.]|nr:hypothetical protein [Herbinix sp.]
MEVLSKIIALILVGVLIFLLPLQYLFGHQLLLFDTYAEDEVINLVDDMREKSFLDIDMYEGFLKKLKATGVSYDIELEHAKPKAGSDMASIDAISGVLVASKDLQYLPSLNKPDDYEDTDIGKEQASTEKRYDTAIDVLPPASGRETASKILVDETPDLISENTSINPVKTNTLYLRKEPVLQDNEITSLATHTHTEDCYKGHNHQASGEKLGYRCPDNAPLTLNYSSSYGQHFGFYCSVCGKEIAVIEHSYDGYYQSYGVKGARYTYRYNTTGMYTQMITEFAHSLTAEHPNWTGDVRAQTVFNQLNSQYVIPSNVPKTYDELYRQYPILLENTNWVTNNQGLVVQGVNPEYKSQAPYNCTAYNHAGNTVTLMNETGYSLISGKEYPKLTLATYQCSADGKQIVHAYTSNWAGYVTGDNTFLVEGVNVQAKSQQAVASIKTYASANGLPQVYVGQYDIAFIMAMYKSNLTTAGYNVVLLENTGYANGARTLPDYSTNYYKINLFPRNASAIPHYLLTSEDTAPYCDQVVTSISATNPIQTVDKGGSIVTTATASYLDGHGAMVNCTSNFNSNLIGAQTVTLTYSGLVGNAKTTGTRTCTVNVTVKETNIPASLTVTPSSYSVYNGSEPTYTVIVTYTNGSTKPLTSGYSISGWSIGYGIKSVTFGYTENGKNVTAIISITVKPNIVNIEITPFEQTVERYKEPAFSVKAWYEDGSYSYASGYTTNGFDKKNIGVQNVTIQYNENSITRKGSANVIVTPMTITCSICGNVYFLDENDFDQGCPICKATVTGIQVSPAYLSQSRNEPLAISVTATYADGHTEEVTGWTSNYDSSRSGSQLVMVTYLGNYAYVNVNVVDEKNCNICGFAYTLNPDGTDPGCPVCKEYLVSISATPDTQTVEQGEDISLAVMGLYRDGHSAEVFGWSSSFNKELAGEQQITVYYQNLTCSTRVNVVSEDEVQCAICGSYYNYRDYPWGCPSCAGTITRIEAKLLSGGTETPYGEALDLSIILNYRDGHREMVYSGWQDNFDPFVLGEQTVTISYTDIFNNATSCTLVIVVSNSLTKIVCENGHVYFAEDAECPYCAANNGKLIDLYSDCFFTDEIINELYESGIYYFSEGDYIAIKVTMRTEGTIYSMGRFRKKEGITPITYGGEVA